VVILSMRGRTTNACIAFLMCTLPPFLFGV
jgi:hypothetical protein